MSSWTVQRCGRERVPRLLSGKVQRPSWASFLSRMRHRQARHQGHGSQCLRRLSELHRREVQRHNWRGSCKRLQRVRAWPFRRRDDSGPFGTVVLGILPTGKLQRPWRHLVLHLPHRNVPKLVWAGIMHFVRSGKVREKARCKLGARGLPSLSRGHVLELGGGDQCRRLQPLPARHSWPPRRSWPHKRIVLWPVLSWKLQYNQVHFLHPVQPRPLSSATRPGFVHCLRRGYLWYC